MLVSATMPSMLIEFARAGLNDPQVLFSLLSFFFLSLIPLTKFKILDCSFG